MYIMIAMMIARKIAIVVELVLKTAFSPPSGMSACGAAALSLYVRVVFWSYIAPPKPVYKSSLTR